MNNALLLEKDQTGEQLSGEAADEGQREPSKVVSTDEFVEVDAQTGRYDAEVIAEVERAGN